MMTKLTFSILAVGILSLFGCNRQASDDVVKETYIHKYGVTVSKADWESRGSDGQMIQTLRDGSVITKNYVNGALEGTSTQTFPHSQTIQTTALYGYDTLVKKIENFPSGLPREENEYSANNTTKTTKWYENGSPRTVEEYQGTVLINGEYYTLGNELETSVTQGDGARAMRNAFGQLISTDTIEAGEMTSQMTYHPNGTPRAIISYMNNVVHGTKKTYHSGGEPNAIEEWENGTQHGITTVFQNGEKFSEVRYVKGKKQGIERRFRDGEIVEEEITWAKDRKHGPSSTYIGDTTQIHWYYQGEKVSKNTWDKLNTVKR